jgi:peptide/nickel transport system substrate-binding protein
MRKLDNQLEDFFGLTSSGEGSGAPEGIRDSLTRKLSLRSRLRLLPKVLSRNERFTVVALAVVAVASLAALPFSLYYHFTEAVPAHGGRVVEGIIGEPRLINPLLAPTNDADRDLAALVYSGLYRYNGEGKLVPDLAKSMPEITSDGLTYSVTIREDAVWHDGIPVTADDVVFTVQTAQNPDYGAPLDVRASWQGVEVERASERVVLFKLRDKYAQFSSVLVMGILPQHLWTDVKPINFPLSELNTKPIGSGPFKFKSLIKDDLGRLYSYKLESFDSYYGGEPYITDFEFRFFADEDQLVDAFNRNDIDSLGYLSGGSLEKLKFRNRIALQQLRMPRYFALFFNQNQSKALSDKNVRLALNYATDRVNIINDTFAGNAFLINSPMMGGILDINANVRTYDYDPEQAASVLTAGGWSRPAPTASVSDPVLQKSKDNTLELKITTSTWPELTSVAQMVKEQWEAVGARVTVETLPIAQLQGVIKNREYQVLLFGQIMQPDPDPFSVWHSSQRESPGRNLSLYSNKTADKLLDEARQTLNPVERFAKYDEFQKVLIEDIPAVFLYSPHYLYGIDEDIRGFTTNIIATPADRFTDVAGWYLETERRFK